MTYHECFLSVSMRWLPPLLLLLLAGDRVGVISFTNYRWASWSVAMIMGWVALLGGDVGREGTLVQQKTVSIRFVPK